MELLRKPALAIPTVMSAIGYALVHDGLKRGITTPAGIAEVGAGRVTDLLDGFVARRYGLATKLGAFADAAFDKKASQEIVDAVSAEGLIPEVFEDAIRSQNLANMTLTGVTKVLHPERELSPTRNGKRFMFFTGMEMGSYALAETVRKREYPRSAMFIRRVGHAMGVAGLFYHGTRATSEYAGRLR